MIVWEASVRGEGEKDKGNSVRGEGEKDKGDSVREEREG